jgi:hypothetical protein
MKRLFVGGMLTSCLVLFSVQVSSAQVEPPKVEIFAGYSYLQTEQDSVPNGGDISVAVNLTPSVSVTADVSAHRDRPIAGGGQTTIVFFRGGPKFKFLTTDRVTPFLQVLAGGVNASTRISGFSGSSTLFSAAAGFGLDVRVSRFIAIRAIQIDYDMILNHGTVVNSGRAAVGVVFRF